MKIKIAIQVVVIAAIIASITGCKEKGADPLTAEERAWLDKNSGKIRFCAKKTNPPFDFQDKDGVQKGITSDFIKLVEDKLNFKVKRVYFDSWNDALEAIKNGKAEIIGSIQDTPKRREYLRFTSSYMHSPNILIVKRNSNKPVSIDSMSGKKVGIVKGYATYEFIKENYPSIQIVDIKTDKEGMQMVSFGQIDGFITDITAATYLLQKLGISNLRIADEVGYEWDLGFGSRKDLPILNSILKKGVALITEAEKESIYNKWIRFEVTPFYENMIFWLLFSVFFGTAASIISILLLVSRTIKKKAAEKLEDQRRFLNSILDQNPLPMWISDNKGTLQKFNPALKKFLNLTEDQGIKKYNVFKDPQIKEQGLFDSFKNALEKGIPSNFSLIWSGENVPDLNLNGTNKVDIEGTVFPITNQAGDVTNLVITYQDVSERKHLEEQLIHSQKMEAIGQLAGGIAHDFNNLLTGIMGNAQLLEMGLSPGCEEIKLANQIDHAAVRAADLTEQLLAFSRKGKLQVTQVNIHKIINEVLKLLSHSIDKRIEIRQFFEASPGIVMGDPTQLQSAILNLGLNARDAMATGGVMTFHTRNITLDKEFFLDNIEEIPPGQYLQIDITDTGIGMSDETLKQIFNPFFTTKEKGQGTGLGLAGVYGCVKSHHGMIRVYSELGIGSTFKLFLPIPELEESKEETKKSKAPIHGHGHILIIDDEELIRNVASNLLKKLGYTVSTCCDGEEGVNFFSKFHEQIDLVILDLIMPKLSGEETFKKLKEIQPDVQVILASGFTKNHISTQMLEEGALAFLNKPFTLDELSKVIAQYI